MSDNELQNGQTAEDGSRPDGSRKRFKRDPRLKVTDSEYLGHVNLSCCVHLQKNHCCPLFLFDLNSREESLL